MSNLAGTDFGNIGKSTLAANLAAARAEACVKCACLIGFVKRDYYMNNRSSYTAPITKNLGLPFDDPNWIAPYPVHNDIVKVISSGVCHPDFVLPNRRVRDCIAGGFYYTISNDCYDVLIEPPESCSFYGFDIDGRPTRDITSVMYLLYFDTDLTTVGSAFDPQVLLDQQRRYADMGRACVKIGEDDAVQHPMWVSNSKRSIKDDGSSLYKVLSSVNARIVTVVSRVLLDRPDLFTDIDTEDTLLHKISELASSDTQLNSFILPLEDLIELRGRIRKRLTVSDEPSPDTVFHVKSLGKGQTVNLQAPLVVLSCDDLIIDGLISLGIRADLLPGKWNTGTGGVTNALPQIFAAARASTCVGFFVEVASRAISASGSLANTNGNVYALLPTGVTLRKPGALIDVPVYETTRAFGPEHRDRGMYMFVPGHITRKHGIVKIHESEVHASRYRVILTDGAPAKIIYTQDRRIVPPALQQDKRWTLIRPTPPRDRYADRVDPISPPDGLTIPPEYSAKADNIIDPNEVTLDDDFVLGQREEPQHLIREFP